MAEKRKYWLHRITGGENGWVFSYPLLNDHNIMSIGWSFLSSQDYANSILARGITAIDEAYQAEGADLNRNRFCLLRFIKEMRSGDVVIIPYGAYFGIYKIADNNIITNETLSQDILDKCGIFREHSILRTEDGLEIDLGFYRRISPICVNIPRNQYASPDILRHMRTLSTNTRINDPNIKTQIQTTISAFKSGRPFENIAVKKNEEYSRWLTTREHSWPYRIFKKSNDELMVMRMAQISSKEYTYKRLRADGARWETPAINYLYTNNDRNLTLKDWSNSFNAFENWSRLNQLMALCSSFESYIVAIVKLAIKSDPGLLIEAPNTVDGIKYIKYDIELDNVNLKELVEGCTKGDWCSRTNNLKKIFMRVPASLEKNIDSLERIRKLRNNLGHAFGRDIDTVQTYNLYKLPKMDTLSSGSFKRLQSIVQDIASDLDKQVMSKHVGNFQPLYYYHTRLLELESFSSQKDKANELKRLLITDANDAQYSSTFCEWVISYYDSL